MRIAPVLLLVACAGNTIGDTGTQTKTFTDPVDLITAETDRGRIDVMVWDGEGIELEFLPSGGTDTWADTLDGTTLDIQATCNDGTRSTAVGSPRLCCSRFANF